MAVERRRESDYGDFFEMDRSSLPAMLDQARRFVEFASGLVG